MTRWRWRPPCRSGAMRVAMGILLLASVFACPSAAAATGPAVHLRVAIGFQSYYNPRVWVPVRVILTWGGSSAVRGVLTFPIQGSGTYPYEGSLRFPVSVKADASTVVTIGVPGRLLKDGGQIEWVVHDTVLATARLLGVPVDADLAGVVSDNPETVQFLAGVSSANGTTELVAPFIAPATLPSSLQLLQSLTYLYIDGGAAQALTHAQVSAIVDWVRAGGILILGGMEPNAGQTAAFARLSPVTPNVVLDEPGTQLAAYAGATPPRAAIAQLVGQARGQSQVIVGTRSQALVAYRAFGRGKVGYVGLSAASADLISWSGNAIFWEELLHSLQRITLPTTPDLFGLSGTSSLMSAAELFPQLHTPPLWIWELVFAIYLIICGPLLYLLLRRRRKSEWAWLLLPGFSIVLAGAIYELGVVQRPNGILTQSVGLVDIVDPATAQAVGVEALMSPQARTYSVVMPPSSWAIPMADRLTGVAEDGQVTFSPGATLLNFSKVQAWGGRFVFALRTVHHLGQLSGDLFSSGRTVGGFLENDTSLDFSSLALVVRGQAFSLGALRSGQTAQVQAFLRGRGDHTTFVNELAAALPSASNGVGRALFDYARALASVSAPPGTAIVIGWTHQQPRLFHTDGAVLSAPPQWIVRELVPITTVVE